MTREGLKVMLKAAPRKKISQLGARGGKWEAREAEDKGSGETRRKVKRGRERGREGNRRDGSLIVLREVDRLLILLVLQH